MSFFSFLQKEARYAEAAGCLYVAGVIEANEAQLAALAGQAPAQADVLVSLVEANDGKLGPIAASAVNAMLNSFRGAIDAEVAQLAGQGVQGIPALVKALQVIAEKLQTEANAL